MPPVERTGGIFIPIFKLRRRKRKEKSMGSKEFVKLCKRTVVDYFNDRADKADRKLITEDDVFVVWSCKTLQNNKALLSTTVSDGMYYELTYNGDANELYLDVYKKWENKRIVVL